MKQDKQDIGWAAEQLRSGKRVHRAGWNGRGMFLEMRKGSELDFSSVWMCTVTGHWVPWTCSQTDLLATDWDWSTD